MRLISRGVGCLVLLLFVGPSIRADSSRARGDKQVRSALETIVQNEKIPGMIAAVVSSEGVVASGAAGIRKVGSDTALTANDRVHIGSCTKAMTSVLMATLVADGSIKWGTRLIEALPELKGSIHPNYYDVTVWQLLTHRAGVPANTENWWGYGELKLRDRRLAILKESLKPAPAVKKGEYLYSNVGYLIAGCIAEKATGLSWESLMQKRLFAPLRMTSAGFGPPGSPGMTDQPWGHVKSKGIWTGKQFDNAEALGPAGRVHCTIEDWGRFIGLFLSKNKNGLSLNDALLKKLITPTGDYAGGWIVTQRPWAKGITLMHTGSNTLWYATVWIAPNLDRAFLVVTNSCDNKSHAVCDKMIGELIRIDRDN